MQSNRKTRRYSKTKNGLSLLSGLGTGAVLMYLFDPKEGRQRRQHLGETAGEALHGTGQVLSDTWGTLSDGTRQLSHDVAGYAASQGSETNEAVQGIVRRTAEIGRDMADRARRLGRDASSRAQSYRPSYFSRPEEHSYPIATHSLTALGCLALGLGAMYLFDPQRGNQRRAVLRDRMMRAVRETGDTFHVTGRHLRNKAYGAVAETRAKFSHENITDEQLSARVRSELGRAVSNPGAIEVTADQGRVTVRGPVRSREANSLISTISSIRGVQSVDNQLQSHDEPGSIPDLQGTSSSS